MKLRKLLILAVILILAIGSVSSLVAKEKVGEEIVVDPPPDDNPGGGVIEGDPWDDDNDDDPGNTVIYPGLETGGKFIQWSIFRFWFTTIKTNLVEIEQPRPVGTRVTVRKPAK